jgi:tetratricopeptide (TPR) repeat protein
VVEGSHVDLDLGAAAVTARLTEHLLDTIADPAARAALYADLGWRYGNAGLYRQALSPTQEASKLYRALAQADPAVYALVAAEEAVAIRQRLAEDNPDAYEDDLATSLNTVSIRFGLVVGPDGGEPVIEGRVSGPAGHHLGTHSPARALPLTLCTTGALAVTAGSCVTRVPGCRAAGGGLGAAGHGFAMIACGKRANNALTAHDHGAWRRGRRLSGYQ